jgi:hypothetical protein
VTTDFLLLHQAQLAQLFKMVISDAWAAEMQGALNFPHADWLPVLQEKPVDFPSFASKRVFKLSFAFSI